MFSSFFLFTVSFIVVALGHPAWIPSFGWMASSVGFALFWISIKNSLTPKKQYLYSFLWSFLVQLVQLSWLVSFKYQGFLILFLYLLLCVSVSVQFSLLTKFLLNQTKSATKSAMLVSSLAVLLEWVRFYLSNECGYTWNYWGMSLASTDLSSQLASVFGVLGLTYYVIFTNVYFFRSYINNGLLSCLKGTCFIALLPYFMGIGVFAYDGFIAKKPKRLMNVVLVQPAFTPSQKMIIAGMEKDFLSPYIQWKRIISDLLVHKGVKIDLIVMPESVVSMPADFCGYRYSDVSNFFKLLDPRFNPEVVPKEPPYFKSILNEDCVSNAFFCQLIAEFFACDVVAGFDVSDKLTNCHHNSAFLFERGSSVVKRCDKQKLLPLAEFLPYDFLKSLAKTYGITEFFTPGSGTHKLSDKLNCSVSVCCEETYPEFVRTISNKNIDFLINITNDAWYPKTNLPMHHFSLGRLRAIESGVPLVRSCNTGVTGVVDARGRCKIDIKPESWNRNAQVGAVKDTVILTKHFTFYSFWGDSAIVSFSLFGLIILGRKNTKQTKLLS
ncbi:MAG: apolipoprotein N-acyltransferase [Chlamydiae bacterium]|nr:apolipoprotein N-acyltransferase [Chlamydiota bacterium]